MLTNRYLCKRCYNNNGVTDEGKVLCSATTEPVQPIEKKFVVRFELCHNKTALPQTRRFAQADLMLLARYARSGQRSAEDIAGFEQLYLSH